ncbi:protein involved in sex pheromone biosynthesis [Borreliella kurtenbachii]
MKYNIIASMAVFLFLTACNPDFNTNQKDVKHQSSKKRS